MQKKTKPSNRTKDATKKVKPAVYVRLADDDIDKLDFICETHGEYRADVIRRIFTEHCAILEAQNFFGDSNEKTDRHGYRSGY